MSATTAAPNASVKSPSGDSFEAKKAQEIAEASAKAKKFFKTIGILGEFSLFETTSNGTPFKATGSLGDDPIKILFQVTSNPTKFKCLQGAFFMVPKG